MRDKGGKRSIKKMRRQVFVDGDGSPGSRAVLRQRKEFEGQRGDIKEYRVEVEGRGEAAIGSREKGTDAGHHALQEAQKIFKWEQETGIVRRN